MNSLMEVIKRPMVTEKGVTKKDSERTLCFEVDVNANKTQIRQAVQHYSRLKSPMCGPRPLRASCGGAAGSPDIVPTGRKPT